MKAMLLAAGESRRLRDEGIRTPKVLLSSGPGTILEHNFQYLIRHGIQDICVNLHYGADQIIKYLGSKNQFDCRVLYSYESKLLGTAGGTKRAASFFGKEAFAVLYGDNALDFDLRAMLAFHKASRADVTLAVFRPDQTRYTGVIAGLVEVSPDGWVRKFIERRGNRKIESKQWANAGLYVVSPRVMKWVPDGRNFDFGKDLFPLLLKKKRKLGVFRGASYVLASDTKAQWSETRRILNRLSKGTTSCI